MSCSCRHISYDIEYTWHGFFFNIFFKSIIPIPSLLLSIFLIVVVASLVLISTTQGVVFLSILFPRLVSQSQIYCTSLLFVILSPFKYIVVLSSSIISIPLKKTFFSVMTHSRVFKSYQRIHDFFPFDFGTLSKERYF